MDDWRRKAITSLKELHHQACFENGDHPDEIDTAYSLGADAIRFETALRARLAEVEKERDNLIGWRTVAESNKAMCMSWQESEIKAEARAERAEAALATARRDAYERAAQVAETAKAVCARCNSPEDNHPYRHPFVPVVMVNIPAAIRALANEAET